MGKTTLEVRADASKAIAEFKNLGGAIAGASESAKKVAVATGAAFTAATAAMVLAAKESAKFNNQLLGVKTLPD